jgi:hypothetical protein
MQEGKEFGKEFGRIWGQTALGQDKLEKNHINYPTLLILIYLKL